MAKTITGGGWGIEEMLTFVWPIFLFLKSYSLLIKNASQKSFHAPNLHARLQQSQVKLHEVLSTGQTLDSNRLIVSKFLFFVDFYAVIFHATRDV